MTPMLIICTTPELAGILQEVDRELDAWFEREYMVQGWPALAVYPKMAWKKFEELEV